jgi:hypothetical protein
MIHMYAFHLSSALLIGGGGYMGYGLYGILNSMVLKGALESNILSNGAKIQEECDLNQKS